MDWIITYTSIAAGYVWLMLGFCLLFWADGRFPHAVDEVCGNSLLRALACIAFWPVALTAVFISAWRRSRYLRRIYG